MSTHTFLLLSVLPFILLSSVSHTLSWNGERPYGQQDDATYNTYPQSSDGYRDNVPPPRVNSQYTNTGAAPMSSSWNSGNVNYHQVQSQFDYKESDLGYGDLGMESQCTKKIYISKDHIIDIQTSVQYGAQLLDGMYAHSFDVCVQSCCQYNGCDLALFKTDGVSQTGKTCYYVHCGLPEHCRMVKNSGFLAGFLVEPDYEETLDNHPEDHKSQFQDSEGQKPDEPPPSVATKPPTETEPATPVSPAVSDTEATPSETAAPVTQQIVTPEPETTERPVSMSTTSSSNSTPAVTEESVTGQPVQANNASADEPTEKTDGHASQPSTATSPATSVATTTTGTVPDAKTNIDDATQNPGTKDSAKDDCGKNGCDGSGLIVMTVIGSLVIVVLLVVAAVVTRRIYKIKTRKQYRNVDYLINGMYT